MSPATTTRLPDIIKRREQDLLERWMKEQLSAISLHRDQLSESQLREQSRKFLGLVVRAAGKTNLSSLDAPAWQPGYLRRRTGRPRWRSCGRRRASGWTWPCSML